MSIIIPESGIGPDGQPVVTLTDLEGVLNTIASQNFTPVSAFGVIANGVADDTYAFQQAVNSGQNLRLIDGTMIISSQINFKTQGQIITGSNQYNTIIQIPTTFNNGTCVFNIGQQGVELYNFCMSFVQPNTTMITYPSAIYSVFPRGYIKKVRITGGTNGIYLTGTNQNNSVGGWFIEDCELACFINNIYINGAADSIRIDNVHIWPFGVGSNTLNTYQLNAFYATTCVGINIGRADDIKIKGGLIICGTGLITFNNPGFLATDGVTEYLAGSCFGSVTGTGFDTYANVQLGGNADLTWSSCYFTMGSTPVPYYAFQQTGGNHQFSSCFFLTTEAVQGNCSIILNGGSTTFTSCYFTMSVNQAVILCENNHLMSLANSVFRLFTSVTSNYVINCNSGSGTISSCVFTGSSGSAAIGINTGLYFSITGCNLNGNTITLQGNNGNANVSGCVNVPGYGISFQSFGSSYVAGNSQATATLITSTITTIIGGTGGVILPSTENCLFVILNRSGNTINVYPPSEGNIENFGTNSPAEIYNAASATLYTTNGINFYAY